jgi:hypothetical protein
MNNSDTIWGPLDMNQWDTVPAISGRLASELDTKEGRAAFYLENSKEIGAQPMPMPLPRCAILQKEEGPVPVVIIQAEIADNKSYIGYRTVTGGNGICTIEEVMFLPGPDARFF